MTDCTLCGLPTPHPPVEEDGVEGVYCCRGCLEVARSLPDPAAADREPEASSSVAADRVKGGTTAYYAVEGMHCATCETYLEDRAREQPAVENAEASYAAELLRVTYDGGTTDADTLAETLSGAGYRLSPVENAGERTDDETTSRLLVGLIFGVMGMMWYVLFLYPTYLGVPAADLLLDVSGPAGTYVLWSVAVMSGVVLAYTGAPLLRGAWVSLQAGRPNMDLLVALAAVTAYSYSLVGLIVGRTEVYFDVAVVIVVVVTVGRYYEERVRSRAGDALADLAAARVGEARRQTPHGVETVPVEALEEDDRIVIKPGERIPVDGTVVEGAAAVDESVVSGEQRPVRRSEGDEVIGGSVATDGRLVVIPRPGVESTVDRLARVLWSVQSERGGAQRFADRLASVFVPLVVLVAIIAGLIHIALGSTPTGALLTSLAVLVVSCPCALGLATPLAVASGIRSALTRGVVITDRAAIEGVAATDVVAFDKTGTLTTGGMHIDTVHGDEDGLARAAAVEQYASHPIAEAITDAADSVSRNVEGFERHPGQGAAATVEGERVVVGRAALLQKLEVSIPTELADRYREAIEHGGAPAYVAWDGAARAVIVASGELRPEWAEVIGEVAQSTDRVVVLTGDDRAAADPMENHEAVDTVYSDVPPEGKAAVIERLQADGTVAMVGDGTNDAPALGTADVGIALGSGTDLAADAADAVIVDDDLRSVPAVFELTSAIRRRIRENLGWAFCYNLVAIPLAAAGLLNPLFAAVAMGASSLLVVANSARPLAEPTDVEGQNVAGVEPTVAPEGVRS